MAAGGVMVALARKGPRAPDRPRDLVFPREPCCPGPRAAIMGEPGDGANHPGPWPSLPTRSDQTEGRRGNRSKQDRSFPMPQTGLDLQEQIARIEREQAHIHQLYASRDRLRQEV